MTKGDIAAVIILIFGFGLAIYIRLFIETDRLIYENASFVLECDCDNNKKRKLIEKACDDSWELNR